MEQNAFEKWYKGLVESDLVNTTLSNKEVAKKAWNAAVIHTVNSFPYISVSMKLADAFIEHAATIKSNS